MNPIEKSTSISKEYSSLLIRLLIFLLAFLMMVSVVYDVYSFDRNLKERGEYISGVARSILPKLIWDVDESATQAVLESLLQEETVVYVKLINEDISVTELSKPAYQGITLEQFANAWKFSIVRTNLAFEDNQVGGITVVFSKETLIDQLLVKIAATLGFVFLVAILMLRSSVRVTERFVFTPIKALQDAATEITQGQLDTVIPVTREDEIGQLARSLDSMRASIKGLIADLRSVNQGLERKVEERTEELRESEQRVNAVLNSIADGIVTIGPTGRVRTFNRAAEVMFGYPEDIVSGAGFQTLVGAEFGDLFEDPLTALAFKGGSTLQEQEIVGKRANGEEFPMEVSLREVPFGRRRFFAVVCRDITRRKELDRMKDEFVSIVSHELRTPLTSISGSLALVANSGKTALPDEARERMIEIAHRNAERLSRLINDLLDIQKIEAGMMRYQFEEESLVKVIETAIEANRPFANQYDVVLETDLGTEDIRVKLDSQRIDQVMTNLVSNAVKFSPKGGKVLIAIKPVDEAGRVRVTVRDHGEGIAKEYREQIFGKFIQADSSTTRKHAGTGLGLSITKHIVEDHGGTIDFDTVMGEGTTFYFDLLALERNSLPGSEAATA